MDRQIQWTGAPIEVVSTEGNACWKASRSSWRPVRHGPPRLCVARARITSWLTAAPALTARKMQSAGTGCRIGPIVHSIASRSSAAPMETVALARCSCIAYRKLCSACVNAVAIRTMAAVLKASLPCADPNAATEIDAED